MSMASEVRLIPNQTESFPLPIRDSLGLANDPIHIAAIETHEGNGFAVAHSRPFMGESMLTLLNSVAPYRHTHWNRRHAANTFEPVEERWHAMDRPGREYAEVREAMHSGSGKHGIGAAYRAFGSEVRHEWAETFLEPSTDAVYAPLSGLKAYPDFTTVRDHQLAAWVPENPDYEGFDRHRPQKISQMLNSRNVCGPETAWSDRDYAVHDRLLKEFFDGLSEDEKDDVVGKALSSHEKPGVSHWPANNLVLDLTGQRLWYTPQYEYGGFNVGLTDQLQFPVPSVTFGDSRHATIYDDSGVAVKLKFDEPAAAGLPSSWTIENYTLPQHYYTEGRYAAIAWLQDQGESQPVRFLDQSETVDAVRQTDMPIAGTPDSYLGRALIRYFRQPGEYVEQPGAPADQKWVTLMGLPGSASKREITQRELPVWLRMPQHQPDLLNSQFLQTLPEVL